MENVQAHTKGTKNAGPLAIVAGNGSYPVLVADGARREGYENIFGIAHHGETVAMFADAVDGCSWIHIGQLGKIIRCLRKQNIHQVIFAGGIKRKKLRLRPDLTGLLFLCKLKKRGDDSVLQSLAAFFESRGIAVLDGAAFVSDCLAPKGCIAGRQPTEREQRDISVGFKAAKALGAADVGQAVVVHDGIVVAVEALEGTDALIKRAGEITHLGDTHPAENGLVLVKVAKPQQEMRIDRPAIGEDTVIHLAEAGGTVLAIEAGTTMLLDAAKIFAACEKAGVTIFGV